MPRNFLQRNRDLKLYGPDDRGKFYTVYRNAEGRSRRKRFTGDKAQSLRMLNRFRAELSGIKTLPDEEEGIPSIYDGTESPLSLGNLVREYREYLRGKVRESASGKADDGTITLATFDLYVVACRGLIKGCKKAMGDQADALVVRPFHSIFTEAHYERMFDEMKRQKKSGSYMTKVKSCFWGVMRLARRNHGVRLSFAREDVSVKISQKPKSPIKIPTIEMLRRLLANTTKFDHRVWIWLGLGCAFGPQDLSVLTLLNFDFDHDEWFLRRKKTDVPRRGRIHPMVKAHLHHYLTDKPRERSDLLFVTRDGNPITWTKNKSDEEFASTQGNARAKRGQSVRRTWDGLMKRTGLDKEWGESFYVLRHLAARVHGTRPGASLESQMAFMGHTQAMTTSKYLQPLTPEERPVIDWIAEMLEQTHIDAWERPTT